MTKLANEYAYAVRNGYKGTHQEYLQLNYEGYKRTMARMQIPAAGFPQWLENQK